MRFTSMTFLVGFSLVACSSSGKVVPSSGVDPVPPSPDQAYDVSLLATANNSSERIVEALLDPSTSALCTTEIVAGCSVQICTSCTTDCTAKPVDAGTVTASSPTFGSDVAIAPNDLVTRVVQSSNWPAGELVELKGTGGADIPAFDVTLPIPAEVTDIAYDGCSRTDASHPCTLSSSSGSQMTWDGPSEGSVSVSLGLDADSGSPRVICAFPGSAHAGKIPAERSRG